MTTTPQQPDDLDAFRTRLEEALAAHLRSAADVQALLAEANARADHLDVTAAGRAGASAALRALPERVRQQLLAGTGAAPPLPCETQDHHHWELVIELWKQTVAVQQHFNDLQLRIRNFAITVFGAVIGAIAFALKENVQFSIGGYTPSLTTAILMGGMLSWFAFYFMDRWWYHLLLVGSVKHGEALELELQAHFPSAGLTDRISQASPIRYGFAVAAGLAAAAVCGVYQLVPATGPFLSGAVLVLLVLLLAMSLMVKSKARWLAIGVFVLLILATLAFWWYGETLSTLICGGGAATLFIVAHEKAGMWMMRAKHKGDLFYGAGLLVYLGIAVCMESINRPAALPTVVTETRSATTTQPADTGTTAVQTTTATTATVQPSARP